MSCTCDYVCVCVHAMSEVGVILTLCFSQGAMINVMCGFDTTNKEVSVFNYLSVSASSIQTSGCLQLSLSKCVLYLDKWVPSILPL